MSDFTITLKFKVNGIEDVLLRFVSFFVNKRSERLHIQWSLEKCYLNKERVVRTSLFFVFLLFFFY